MPPPHSSSAVYGPVYSIEACHAMYLRRIVHNKTWDFSLFQILIGDCLEALWYHEKNCLYAGNTSKEASHRSNSMHNQKNVNKVHPERTGTSENCSK